MNDTVTRRPIGAHPAFTAAVTLWLAALLGLTVLVLPGWALADAARSSGIVNFLPGLEPPVARGTHIVLSLAAAGLGAALGLAIALPLARRARRKAGYYEDQDENIEPEAAPDRPGESGVPAPRLLRIREELEADFAAEPDAVAEEIADWREAGRHDPVMAPVQTPPVQTPGDEAPDQSVPVTSAATPGQDRLAALERMPLGELFDRFDRAFGRAAPRVAGSSGPKPAAADNQARLRAALDKLAEAEGKP